MKPKLQGFKEGVLLETLRSMGGEHLKGSKNIEMLLSRYMLFRHKERMAEIKLDTI